MDHSDRDHVTFIEKLKPMLNYEVHVGSDDSDFEYDEDPL